MASMIDHGTRPARHHRRRSRQCSPEVACEGNFRITVIEASTSGSQPSPTAGDTWARVARRIRVPLGFAFTVVYLWLARPTTTSLITGALVLLPGLILRGLASGHVQKDKQLTKIGRESCRERV